MSTYRLGLGSDDTVYLQTGDRPTSTDERVAIFTRAHGDAGVDALQYVKIMNATMPRCDCPIVCPQCSALTGSHETGCEACAEHNIEHDFA